MDRQYTKNELDMQNIDAMRGECCVQIIAELKAGIDELCDELTDKYENHAVEVFPGTMAALDDLFDLRRERELEDARDVMAERYTDEVDE